MTVIRTFTTYIHVGFGLIDILMPIISVSRYPNSRKRKIKSFSSKDF